MKSEQQMREEEVPTPKTSRQLSAYIDELVDRQHSYGTCVYAMSMAATAAFNYVASKLGVTGFQASCADLDVLRRTRRIEGPFMILFARDLLYPQYDLHAKVDEMADDARGWLSAEARKKLNESPDAHPDVVAHWKRLAKGG